MSQPLSKSVIREIFSREIAPDLQAQVDRARSDERYVLVFVGDQPGAGKSRLVAMALAEHRGAVEINGDDLRKYHPDYDELMETAPLTMPDATAAAAGAWVSLSASYLRNQGAGVVLETTMRQADVVSTTASEFKRVGYAIESRSLAVPAAVSRLGTLQRYAEQIRRSGAGRWTPTRAHDSAVEAMPGTVEALVDAGLVDRGLVQRRDGTVVFDRAYDPTTVTAGDGAALRERIEFGRAVSSMAEGEARDWVRNLVETSTYLSGRRLAVGPDVERALVGVMQDAREVASAGWPTDLERRSEALTAIARSGRWLVESGSEANPVEPHNPMWNQPGAGPAAPGLER